MKQNQRINCTVKSCAYNDSVNRMCELDKIVVEPCTNCNNGNPEDESMCGNYEHLKK